MIPTVNIKDEEIPFFPLLLAYTDFNISAPCPHHRTETVKISYRLKINLLLPNSLLIHSCFKKKQQKAWRVKCENNYLKETKKENVHICKLRG